MLQAWTGDRTWHKDGGRRQSGIFHIEKYNKIIDSTRQEGKPLSKEVSQMGFTVPGSVEKSAAMTLKIIQPNQPNHFPPPVLLSNIPNKESYAKVLGKDGKTGGGCLLCPLLLKLTFVISNDNRQPLGYRKCVPGLKLKGGGGSKINIF